MVKTQGRRGEVAVDVLTDFPERFAEPGRVFVLAESGERRELRLEGSWPHKQRLVLKFVGVDSISDAEALAGCEIQIPASERAPLEEGAAYVADLAGCEVLVGGAALGGERRTVGTVRDVQFGAGEAPLLVVRSGKEEFLIPFAQAYLRRVDVGAKKIEMELPEGMLELDAPLSKNEKDEQGKRSNE